MKHLVNVLDLLKKHGYSDVNYYDLGLYLGLFPDTLDVIKIANKGDAHSCLRDCLKEWLQRVDNVKSSTYDALIQALRKTEENDVADGIERQSKTNIKF
uniref:Death domain-containing protein n=1 Tax=Amphimedon queenslandica TaxID=400682 RepID=A0A1X7SDB9_AMPQE